ncbi:MAG: CopY family transcriptional regulator, partial [Actinomycetes bacterium]
MVEDPVTSSPHHGYISSKDAYLKRLRRIEGQAR